MRYSIDEKTGKERIPVKEVKSKDEVKEEKPKSKKK